MIKVFCVLFLGGCIFNVSAFAGNYCHIDMALAAYKSGLQRKAIDDQEGAFVPFSSLAEIGFAPAQRQLAEYYLEESRDKNALELASMWAQLAAWGGDRDAQVMVKRLAETLRDKIGETALELAKAWVPVKSVCGDAPLVKDDDLDLRMAGRFPLYRGVGIDDETFTLFAQKLTQAIDTVDSVARIFGPLVDLIPQFEVIKGEGSDRFMAWDRESATLRISSGYLNDVNEHQLAYALVLAVQREIYSEIKGSVFLDPVGVSFGSFTLYGSLYGDVKTPRFLSVFQEALKLSSQLPVVLHDMVFSLNEIYYMPGSRFQKTLLSGDHELAEYDYKRSNATRRMGIVFKRMSLESPEDILLHLVRIGYFAQQHGLIEGFRNKTEGKSRENMILKALEGNGMSPSDLFNQKTSKNKELVDAWDKEGPTHNKQMACDAVSAQIKAAIALKMQASVVARSVKLQACTKARKAWNSYRSQQN